MKYLGYGTYALSEIPFYVRVGRYTSIAEDVEFVIPHTHLCVTNRDCVFTNNWGQPETSEITEVGSDVWIGQGAKILSGVKIGHGSIIGAYSVIAKNVEPYSVVVGNPQVVKRMRFNKKIVDKLLEMRWWDWEKEWIVGNIEVMKNVNNFINSYDQTPKGKRPHPIN